MTLKDSLHLISLLTHTPRRHKLAVLFVSGFTGFIQNTAFHHHFGEFSSPPPSLACPVLPLWYVCVRLLWCVPSILIVIIYLGGMGHITMVPRVNTQFSYIYTSLLCSSQHPLPLVLPGKHYIMSLKAHYITLCSVGHYIMSLNVFGSGSSLFFVTFLILCPAIKWQEQKHIKNTKAQNFLFSFPDSTF